MIRFVRNSFRLLAMARTLARYDALFPLALVPGGKLVAFLARLTAPFSRRSDLPPGKRLARALEELGARRTQPLLLPVLVLPRGVKLLEVAGDVEEG